MFREVKMKNDKLHNIKSTGYKTPDNYFENFEVTLLEQLKENKLIKDIDTSGFFSTRCIF